MKRLIAVLLIIFIASSSLTGWSATPASIPTTPTTKQQQTYSIMDALEILKSLAGISSLTTAQRQSYDLDGTPGIGIGDALEILKYLAGIPNAIGTLPLSTAKPPSSTSKPPTTTAKPPATTAPPASDTAEFAAEVVRLTNIERANAGLPALAASNSALTAAAGTRAKEIIVSFSHTRPDGRSCFTAFDEHKVSYRGAGENIAWGQSTPQAVVTGWMNSPGHKANILGNYTHIGVGVEKSGGRYYWVQLFIR